MSDAGKTECSLCGRFFKDLSKHTSSCQRKLAEKQSEERRKAKAKAGTASSSSSRAQPTKTPKPWERLPYARTKPSPVIPSSGSSSTVPSVQNNLELGPETPTPSIPPSSSTAPPPGAPPRRPRAPQEGDIRTEYHPNSGREARHDAFEDYRRQHRSKPTKAKASRHDPWYPFASRADFEFSELALKSCLNQSQISAFLDVFQRCLQGEDKLNFTSYDDLANSWNAAQHLLTPIKSEPIRAILKDVEHEYEFWHRDLWKWAKDLIQDEDLAPYFEWDAQRLSIYDAEREQWVRFVNEPWTADRFFEAQSTIPEGKIVPIILYADKTELSSFGGQKGYPVYARLGNLPVSIRNGSEGSLGGGRLVGWIPIPQDSERAGASETQWADFKRVVWHQSFIKLLASLTDASKRGEWVLCGDGIKRRLWPVILILSADYEEQSTIANIRGAKGAAPCPICLVPKDELWNITKSYPMRDIVETERLVNLAKGLSAKEGNKLLQPYGLRPVNSAFTTSANADPFKGLSFDRLHSYGNGLGAKRLWVKFHTRVKSNLGEAKLRLLEERARSFPRWGGLNHFTKVLSTKFQDANKNEDLMKISLFIGHNVFPAGDLAGEQLMRCFRHFLNLDTLASFTNHSDITIDMIRVELKHFEVAVKAYVSLEPGEEPWRFPKVHMHSHLPEEIYAKGVTRNTNTKPNESMHRFLKEFYLFMTNFKNVEGKILQLEHWCYTAAYIRAKINAFDGVGDLVEAAETTEELVEGGPARSKQRVYSPKVFGNITLGSAQTPSSLATFSGEPHHSSPRFSSFQTKLQSFLSSHCPVSDSGTRFRLGDDTMIQEFFHLKAAYESRVTWEVEVDLLRCNPCFLGQPRYDAVMLQGEGDRNDFSFGRLIALFTVADPRLKEDYPLAYVELFDGTVTSSKREKDASLGFLRVRQSASPKYAVVFARSIIRGALLVPTFEGTATDYFVFDVVDGDMFLRVREVVSKYVKL